MSKVVKHSSRLLYKICCVMLVFTIAISIIPSLNYCSSIANNSGLQLKPVVLEEEHEVYSVTVKVYMFIEPLKELEQTSLIMIFTVLFNFSQVSKIKLLPPDGEDNPIFFQPEKFVRKVSTQNTTLEIVFPTSIPWIFTITAASDTAGKDIMLKYSILIDIIFRNGSEKEGNISSNYILMKVLPGSSTFPKELTRPLLTSLVLTFLLPLLTFYVNRRRSKKIRLKLLSVKQLLALLLFFYILMPVTSVSYAREPAISHPFIASYLELIFEDVYDNDTYIATFGTQVYVWFEKQVNLSSVIIGEMRLTSFPLETKYIEINLEKWKTNNSDGWIPWWISPNIKKDDAISILNKKLKVEKYGNYYYLSALRKSFKLSFENKTIRIRAEYDATTGILYRWIEENKEKEILHVYILNSSLGLDLSVAWQYYYIMFSAMILIPTILTLIFTWPKTPKRRKKNEYRYRG